MRFSSFLILTLLLNTSISFGQLVAFPGAVGFGMDSNGGRGGAVIEVTNLNDAGPGSFRDAVAATGPRTIVFRTGGVIALQEEIQITEPFLTIAAQTAPGGGIVLKNFGLATFTHDIVIRGLRIRPGDDLHTLSPDNRDCIAIQDGSYNIALDHCSFSWGVDENVSLLGNVDNVTVQWCNVSEALYSSIHPKGPHSMGLLSGYGAEKVSVHHNLFAHNNGRNPLFLECVDHEFVNNTVFDWGYSSEFQRNTTLIKADIVGNRWKPLSGPFDLDELPLSIDFDITTANGSLLHVEGDFWAGGPFLTPPQIAAFGVNAPLFPSTSVLTQATTTLVDDVHAAHQAVLGWSGAIHPQRDEADVRAVSDAADSTGIKLDCIRATPLTLDSGTVISATANSFTYSVLADALKYSPEGRRVQIVAGTGTGQMRMGVGVNTIDQVNQIVEGLIDQPWTTMPDATSQFKVIALCENTLGGYPTYAAGTPYTDSDHDGMPDDWELANGLNPNDASDRNGTGLNPQGYTNLEVYLNGYYASGPPNEVGELAEANHLNLYPNPSGGAIVVQRALELDNQLHITDLCGKQVLSTEIEGQQWVWNGLDQQGKLVANGTYLICWGSRVGRAVISR